MDVTASAAGPLTTTFTPAPSCTSVALTRLDGGGGPEYSMGARCSPEVNSYAHTTSAVFLPDPACYPSADALASDNGILHFFSPALACPVSWTAASFATMATDITTSPTGWQKEMFTVMSHKETLVWCCPTGYSMDNDDRGSFCHSRVPTQTQYFYTTVGIATDCKPTTVTLEKKDYAPSASAKVLRLVVPTNGTFDPPLKNPGPSSLPRILLISILTPVGAIGLGILILFTRRARKRKRSRLGSQRAVTSSTRPNVEEKPKAEINQSGRTELSGGPVPLRSELASDPNSRHELNANSQVSELPGHAAVELEANNLARVVD